MFWSLRRIAWAAGAALTIVSLVGCGSGSADAPATSSSLKRWVAAPESKATPNPVAPTPESMKEAQALFKENCAGCHNENGDGKGPASVVLPRKAANFTDAATMATMTDGELFWKMSNGRAPMPAWADSFTVNQRWQLVNYIRAFSNPNGQATVAAK